MYYSIFIFRCFINLIVLLASMKNFATRVSDFFTRKKKDAAKEVEETEKQVDQAVDQVADKTAKAKEEFKQELGMFM